MDTLTNNLQVGFVCDEGDALISMDLDAAFDDLGNFTTDEFVDLIFEQATLDAEALYPMKHRVIRRKQTVKKHRRLDAINSYYYTGEEEKHDYQMKPNKKKSASRVKMNKYPDHRKFKDYDFAESLADYRYQCKVDDFYKLVDAYLAV